MTDTELNLKAERAAYLAAFPDVHFSGAWTARNEQDFAVWIASANRRASSAAAVPVDAASIYREALEHAAFYVRDHLQHGDEHADIIATMRMPSKYENAAAGAAPVDALPPLPDPIEVGGEGWGWEDFQSWKTFTVDQMQAYARAAVEADRAQRLPELERRCLHPTCTGSCEDCYYSQRITHRDDAALEIFVKACKAKMAKGRSKGRGGWEDSNQCPTGRLQGMLLDHLDKGDPLDVALFCMMLWMRGAPVVAVNLKAKLQAALEDAATICDNFAKREMHPAECASAIRMMKDSIK